MLKVTSMVGKSTKNHNPATHTGDMKQTHMVRAALNHMVQVAAIVMALAVVRATVQVVVRVTGPEAEIRMAQVAVRI
jgi:hypothetical protein